MILAAGQLTFMEARYRPKAEFESVRFRGLKRTFGFENLEIGEYIEPALTTVEVSGAEMGIKAADIIVSLLAKSERAQNVRLDAPLIVRRSSGPASIA